MDAMEEIMKKKSNMIASNGIGDESLTNSMPGYPCSYCGRRNCTMSVSSYGKCPYFTREIIYDNMVSGESETKQKNYVKKSHHKKRNYHRGKF